MVKPLITNESLLGETQNNNIYFCLFFDSTDKNFLRRIVSNQTQFLYVVLLMGRR